MISFRFIIILIMGNLDYNDRDYIDISSIFTSLWSYKFSIISITFMFSLIGIGYALYLPNIYKAESLIITTEQKSSSSSSNLGGLARLAGVDVQASSGGKSKEIIIKTLKSRKFIMNFINKNDILPEVLGAVGADGNGVIFDDSIYDSIKNEWSDNYLADTKNPSLLEGHEQFLKNNMKLQVSDDDGSMILSTFFYDPKIAYNWNIKIIQELNEFIKQNDIKKNTRLVEFYKSAISENQSSQIQLIIGALLNDAYKEIALMDSDPEYILTTIDPALVPEKHDTPRRSIIVVLITIIGFIIGILYALLKENYTKLKS